MMKLESKRLFQFLLTLLIVLSLLPLIISLDLGYGLTPKAFLLSNLGLAVTYALERTYHFSLWQ